jgi:hypothetical protein
VLTPIGGNVLFLFNNGMSDPEAGDPLSGLTTSGLIAYSCINKGIFSAYCLAFAYSNRFFPNSFESM